MWYAFGTLSRWLLFSGALLAVGAIVFRIGILPGTRGTEPDARPHDLERVTARTGALAARLAILGALGRLVAQIGVFRDPFEPLLAELRLLVFSTTWGTAWVIQIAVAALALGAFVLAAGRGRGLRFAGWTLAAGAILALCATPAFSGHAYGSERWTGLAVGADTAHVVAGGVWLGTLALIGTAVRSGARAGTPVPRGRVVAWIGRFSPLALVASATLAITGTFAGWLHIDTLSSLWTSSYGQRLLIKLAVLGVIVACGAYNWQRSRTRIEAEGDGGSLPATIWIELGAGVLILLATAILVDTPLPGE